MEGRRLLWTLHHGGWEGLCKEHRELWAWASGRGRGAGGRTMRTGGPPGLAWLQEAWGRDHGAVRGAPSPLVVGGAGLPSQSSGAGPAESAVPVQGTAVGKPSRWGTLLWGKRRRDRNQGTRDGPGRTAESLLRCLTDGGLQKCGSKASTFPATQWDSCSVVPAGARGWSACAGGRGCEGAPPRSSRPSSLSPCWVVFYHIKMFGLMGSAGSSEG